MFLSSHIPHQQVGGPVQHQPFKVFGGTTLYQKGTYLEPTHQRILGEKKGQLDTGDIPLPPPKVGSSNAPRARARTPTFRLFMAADTLSAGVDSLQEDVPSRTITIHQAAVQRNTQNGHPSSNTAVFFFLAASADQRRFNESRVTLLQWREG